MSRIIKFRAWDATRSKMFPDVHNRIDFCEILHMPEPFTVMQFTGCKDENDVDAYEGDIVENKDGDRRIIMWVLNGFEMRLKDYSLDLNRTSWYFRFTIIGNIYENPELL